MRVKLLTASCTKTQSVEISPMPTSTTTVGEPWPLQCKCILWPATSKSLPGGVGIGGSDCAGVSNANGKSAVRKRTGTAARQGMEIPPVGGTKETSQSFVTSRNLERNRSAEAANGIDFSVFFAERGAFARNEKRRRRINSKLLRKVALIDGDADTPARILIQKRVADGDVHKGFAEREHELLTIQQKADLVADGIAERSEVVASNVGDERAKWIIEANNVATDSFFIDGGGFGIQAYKFADLWTCDGVIPSRGEMCGGGRKNVAAMKRGRDGGSQHPGCVGDFVCGIEAAAIEEGSDQTIVGQNEILALFCFDDDRFAGSADARVHDGKKNGAGRIVRSNGCEEARAFFDLIRRDLVREVGHEDDSGAWRIWLQCAALLAVQFFARSSEQGKHNDCKHKWAETALHEQIPPTNSLKRTKASIRERRRKRMHSRRKS